MNSPAHLAFWPPHLPTTLDVPVQTLHAHLATVAAAAPGRALCHFYGATLTYGEGWRQIEALAGFLQQDCGVRPGDRVLLCMQNSPNFLLAYYAILRADAVIVPVNPLLVTAELRHCLDDSGARVALAAQECVASLLPLVGVTALARIVVATYSDYLPPEPLRPLPDVVTAARTLPDAAYAVAWHEALARGRVPAPSGTGPEALCALPYTSGTTGSPKGCMHTHAAAMWTAWGVVVWQNLREDCVALVSVPMFHVTGMQVSMNAALCAGTALVLMTRWDPQAAGALVEYYRCTHWVAVPTMVVDLLSHPGALERDVSSLRSIVGGGAAMPEAIAAKLKDRCGVEYVEGYGLTETMAPTHLNPGQRPKRQCAGIPFFGTEALIVDPATLTVLPVGERGEILVRGPQVFQGYWNNPRATADAFAEVDGRRWFRTGDLGYVDEDGYYFVADRIKRMINAAGLKVWPAEVEAVLYRHPAIREACVIASPDARRGEQVKAVVVRDPGAPTPLTQEALIIWARTQMAAYKVPRIVEFVAALPRTGSGKIMWRALQEKEFGADNG
ncbi:MAG: AMP-binding protein [Gammaproteobacteria bacterium]|nr:AMP-binding protein [Gammaproteobacteria bacterium]